MTAWMPQSQKSGRYRLQLYLLMRQCGEPSCSSPSALGCPRCASLMELRRHSGLVKPPPESRMLICLSNRLIGAPILAHLALSKVFEISNFCGFEGHTLLGLVRSCVEKQEFGAQSEVSQMQTENFGAIENHPVSTFQSIFSMFEFVIGGSHCQCHMIFLGNSQFKGLT